MEPILLAGGVRYAAQLANFMGLVKRPEELTSGEESAMTSIQRVVSPLTDEGVYRAQVWRK